MLEIDLSEQIPAAANIVEIRFVLDHPGGSALVYRGPDDDSPLEVRNGTTARFGIGDCRLLTIRIIEPARSCTADVLGWSE